MKDLDETLLKIHELLHDYVKNNTTNSIDYLLDIQDKLCIWGMRLAEITADCKTTYNYQYFIRKIHVSKQIQNLIKQGTRIGQASNSAIADNEEVFNAEQESESIAYKADLILKQLNKSLSAIQQRISHLKYERQNAQNTS